MTGNTTPAHGAVTVNGDGSYSYTPAPGFSGTDTFHYTVTDNLGRTATATVTITVIPLPPAPIARPDSGTTPVNTPLIVVAPGALSNDNGSTISVTGHTSPSHGVVVVQASGATPTPPPPGYSGPDTFTYTTTDAYGRTATATVTIQVTPVAKPDSATTPMGIPVTISSLTNDTGTQLTLTATTQPAHGSVSITNNRLVFTPPAGFTGTTTFTYTATDASGQSVTAQVTVTVGPAFGPPISTGTGSGSGSTAPPDRPDRLDRLDWLRRSRAGWRLDVGGRGPGREPALHRRRGRADAGRVRCVAALWGLPAPGRRSTPTDLRPSVTGRRGRFPEHQYVVR